MADGSSATLAQRTRAAKEHVRVEWDASRAARLAERASARQRRRALARGVASAAAAAAVITIAWMGWSHPSGSPGVGAPVASPSHAREASGVLRFADGSVATPLDGSSELVVSAVTEGEIAVEVVRGGGRFEVTPGLPRRFRVRAGTVLVGVLGTVFTVRREGEGASVEVERGRVQVRWEPAGEAILESGESGAFPRRDDRGETGARADTHADTRADTRADTDVGAEAAEPEAEVQLAPDTPASIEVSSGPTSRRERPGSSARVARAEIVEREEPALAASEPPRGWRALADQGRFDEGYGLLLADPAVLRSDDLEVLMQAADVARLSGHPGESLAYLRRALEVGAADPRAPMAAFTLGRVLLQELGRPAEAAAAFARCRELAPQGSLASDALAREVESWYRAGDTERARERALEYLRLHPRGLRASAVRRYGGIE